MILNGQFQAGLMIESWYVVQTRVKLRYTRLVVVLQLVKQNIYALK